MSDDECDMIFLNCEYMQNGHCALSAMDKCVYSLIHSRYSDNEIKLANDDAYNNSYVRGLPHIEKTICDLKNGGGVIEPTMQSRWKYMQQNHLMPVPFDPKKIDGDAMLLIADLKRFKYSSRAVKKHSKQLHLYALSIKQQYDFKDNPYFIDVLYRPSSTDTKGMHRNFKSHLGIIKSQGELEKEFFMELDSSYAQQEKILQSSKEFNDYKEHSRLCEGCFKKEMCNGIESLTNSKKCTLEEYLVDELKALESPLIPRGSAVGYKCEIEKILSVVSEAKLPPELRSEDRDDSKVGHILHTAFNDQHCKDFIHNQMLKEKLNMTPVSRTEYCEFKTILKREKYQVKGKADAVLMLVRE